MTKQDIMRTANEIIETLIWCDDEEFLDRIISAIVNGECFTEEEIEEWI